MIKKILNYECHPFLFGVYRISLGFFLLIYMLLMSNRWIEFYGPYGISPIKLRNSISFYMPSVLSYIHTETGLWIYYGFIMVMLIAMILGWFGRIPAFFVWLAMISIQNSNPADSNAEEYAICVLIFYAMIMPCTSTLVFDWKTKRLTDSQKPVRAWTLIPFLAHIDLIYMMSLPLKPYFDHAWVDGTLIYYAVNAFDYSRIPGWFGIFAAGHAILSRLATWASLLVELAFPLLIWTRTWRVPVVLGMLAFQIGIAVMLSGIQVFSLAMLAPLIMFLPSDRTYEFCKNPKGKFLAYLFGR